MTRKLRYYLNQLYIKHIMFWQHNEHKINHVRRYFSKNTLNYNLIVHIEIRHVRIIIMQMQRLN